MTALGDAAIYLINFDGEAALVDAGCGGAEKRLLQNIMDCGVQPERIEYLLITHCHYDHTGGVQTVRERIHCQVVAHELEAVFLEQGDNIVTGVRWYGGTLRPFKVDRTISGDSEKIIFGP